MIMNLIISEKFKLNEGKGPSAQEPVGLRVSFFTNLSSLFLAVIFSNISENRIGLGRPWSRDRRCSCRN